MTNKHDMISSVQNISNQKGGIMRRYLLVAIVVLASLTTGACAGRIRVASQPIEIVNEVAQSSPEPELLPIRAISLAELLIPPAYAADELIAETKPSCDIAAVVADTFSDPMLASASLTTDGKLHSYVEVRAGKATTYKDYEKGVALRVLNTETCTTEIVTVRKTYGTRVIAIPTKTKTGTVAKEYAKPAALLKQPTGWEIEVVRRKNGIEWNNWGTIFRITKPEHRIVVGLKYAMVEAATRKRPLSITGVIYVPQSEELMAVPELIHRGIAYIREQEQRVKDDLRARGVRSKALPEMLIADAMDQYPSAYPLQQLLPIEHMDMSEFLLDPEWTARRVFMVIGANGSRFATHTCSPAKACGPQQFMPASYRMVRDGFATAGLIRDVDAGRRDGFNSMKAAALLLDIQLRQLIAMHGQSILKDARLSELQIAGYNTGASRAGRVYGVALAKNLIEWADARGKRCSRANKYAECLLAETKGYIAKYRYLTLQWLQDQELALKITTTP